MRPTSKSRSRGRRPGGQRRANAGGGYWPEVADLASVAINQAVSGGDVDTLMREAAERANHVVQRALR